jgi:hypothetical protein
MTLGNSPQSLTRRQLRELALAHAPEATTDEQNPDEQNPDAQNPDAQNPDAQNPDAQKPSGQKQQRRAGTPETTQAGETPPRATGGAAASDSSGAGKRPAPERTLTRRQLRAVKAASKDNVDAAAANESSADEATALGPLNPPVGHWSVDREEDEHIQTIGQGQPFDQFMSRGIAAGGVPTTTNALILPSIPQQGTTSGPLTSTGEILVTGSFDLPRSLGATGQHPNHFDSSDMDHMIDQLDEGAPNSSVAPVSASRAVSTHTSTRGVMTPPQKRGVSLSTVLPVAAAVLGVCVVALFVLGAVFKIF